MINKERFELWLGDLEGDEYQQCRGLLRDWSFNGVIGVVGHCAVGVLIEVAGRAMGENLWTYESPGLLAFTWLGFDAQGPRVPASTFSDEDLGRLSADLAAASNGIGVVVLNDRLGKTFPEIAQLLRKEYC